MARLDWYQATIDEYPRVIADAIADELPGVSSLSHGRGRQNYHHSTAAVSASGDVLATVLHGGPNGSPNVVASGEQADAFAAIIRRHWPEAHRVSRLDSAEDVHGDFASAVALCRSIGAARKVKGQMIAPDDPADGATYYLGSPSSSIRFRLYEKGKQLRLSAADPTSIRPDWLRFETQYRPVRDAKVLAASLTAAQVWGVSPWTIKIAQEGFAAAPDRLIVQPRLHTTFERRDRALRRQFGPHIHEHVRRCGHDPEAFMAAMLRVIGVGSDDD